MLFSHYAMAYLKYKEGCARNTFLQSYHIVTMHLIPRFGKKEIALISEVDFEDFLREKKIAGYRIYDMKKHIKAILKYAKKRKENITVFELEVYDPVIGRGKIFTREEIVRLLWLARNRSNNGYKSWNLRLQVYMALSMGMRKGEILGFKWEYINFKTGWIYLPPEAQKVKTQVDRAFPCNRIVLRILKKRFARSHSPYLFPSEKDPQVCLVSNNSPWVRLKKRAKVDGRFHDLRHTACSQMLGVCPEAFVKKILGMCSDTIKRYAHVPDRDALRAVNYGLKNSS